MALLFLYIAFFGIWAAENYRKCGFNISVFLLCLYTLGPLCCLWIMYNYPTYVAFPERITFTSVGCHIALLWLFIYPLVRYGNTIDIDNFHVERRRLDLFSWCVVVPSVLAVIASCIDITQIFLYRDFLMARKAFMADDISNLYPQRYGLFGYFLSLGPQVSWLAMFLFFYYFFVLKSRSALTWLLLFSTLAIVANNLAIVGREGFVRWFLYAVVAAILMRKHIHFNEHRRAFMVMGVIGVAILTFFAAITIDRFDMSNKGQKYGILFSLMRYTGEQFYLFSYNFERFFEEGYDSVGGLFPSITRAEFQTHFLNRRFRADFFLNTFPTFVGTFIARTGFFNTVALALSGFFFFFISFWKKSDRPQLTLTRMTGYLFYYEFVMLGFFYFLHGGRFTQYSIVFYLLLAYCISRFTFKSNRV